MSGDLWYRPLMNGEPIKITNGPIESMDFFAVGDNPVDVWAAVAKKAWPEAVFDEEAIAVARSYCGSDCDC